METDLGLTHERIDAIPVVFAMARRLGLAEILDRHLGRHGNQRGLSYGWLVTIWIAYILSEGDHLESAVEAWSPARPRRLGVFDRRLAAPGRHAVFPRPRLVPAREL